MLNVRQSKGAGNSATSEDLRIVADGLTSHGFDVRSPAWEDTQLLRVTNVRGMLCEVTISSTGRVCWECRRLCEADQLSPAQVVNMVTGILGTGKAISVGQQPKHHPGLTLKGDVGRALAERGMDVRLAVLFQDQATYEVCAEVEVTNPAQRERGRVLVGDDGSIRWDCHLRHLVTGAAGVTSSEIAGAVAMALAGRST